jgi:hypothetical protein
MEVSLYDYHLLLVLLLLIEKALDHSKAFLRTFLTQIGVVESYDDSTLFILPL